MPDIFVSYAREDSAFVRKLVDALKAQDRDIWVDFDDIPFASEWWKEVVEGIESSAAGVFIISADSINSQYCSLELSELINNHKKIVPIVVSRPNEEQMAKLPQTIRNLNWVFFDDASQFEASLTNLTQALDTDLDFLKEHTRLLVRANEWEKRGQNRSLLARGQELADFLPMLKEDNLAPVQRNFVNASLVQAEVEQRLWRFICGFLGGLLGMGYFTLATWNGALQPISVLLSISVGEFFGVFIGIIAVFANDVPVTFQKFIPRQFHLLAQILICLIVSLFPWVCYKWFFLNIPPTITLITFIGSLGLALGFIVHALLKPHILVTFVLSALSIFLPILLFNSQSSVLESLGINDPLIYFRNLDQVFWIGLPVALLFALGGNGQNIYHWLFGAEELTHYFSRKTGIFAEKETVANA